MSLKNSKSFDAIEGINYQNFLILQIICSLQEKIITSENSFKKINFEQISTRFQDGIKRQLIKNIAKIDQKFIEIPQNVEIKTLETLVKELGKQASHLTFYFKIFEKINHLTQEYRHKKQKIIKQIKEENQIQEKNSPKNSKQQSIQASTQLKITLKNMQDVKKQIMTRSQNFQDDGTGLMKNMAQVFRQLKKSQNIAQQDLKQIIINRMISKSSLNASIKAGNFAESFILGKQQTQQKQPFDSSIVLQNKILNEDDLDKNNNNYSKFRLFKAENKFSFGSQCFRSQKQDQYSLINIKSEAQNFSDISSDFLQSKNNFQDDIQKFGLPYIKFLYPNEITKSLATKDNKFEKLIKTSQSVDEQQNKRLIDFSKLVSPLQLYYQKKSKYYIDQNLKKIKSNFNEEEIIAMLNQLYWDEDSILVTLNQKQLESNKVKQQRGNPGVEEKYKKASFTFLLKLLKDLGLLKCNLFQFDLNFVQKFEEKLRPDPAQRMSSGGSRPSKLTKEQPSVNPVLKLLKQFFPLNDLTTDHNSIDDDIEIMFGRVFLTKCILPENFSINDMKCLIEFVEIIQENISSIEQRQENTLQIYNLKFYFCGMLIWQILKVILPSELLKEKLEFLIQNISKEFLVEIYDPTQLLLKDNQQLTGIFNTKIMKII